MKNLSLTFTLLCCLTLSNVLPLQAMQPAQQERKAWRLVSILKKKLIDKQPLEKDEKEYLDKVLAVVPLGAAAILYAFMLFGTPVIALMLFHKENKEFRASSLQTMKDAGVVIKEGQKDTLMNLIGAMQNKKFVRRPLADALTRKYIGLYADLSAQGGFKEALSSILTVPISELPTLKEHGKGAYYFE